MNEGSFIYCIKNRYRILKQLGEGGMGTVYLAEDILTDNMLFAVKTIRHSIINKFRAMGTNYLKNEYEIMTRLKHPNLVRVFELGEDNNNYFIVMEYIEGELLSKHIKQPKRMRIERIIRIIVGILRAMEYIHSRDIIYRDIKPGNIMLSGEGVKLLDFGLSSYGENQGDNVKGTMLYMSPDALSGRNGTFNDIFSIGALFFEMMTGSFYLIKDRPDIGSVIKLLRDKDDYISFQKERLGIIENEDIRNIIQQMTDYDHHARYETCSMVIEAINRIWPEKFEYETKSTKQSYVLGNAFADRIEEMRCLKSNLFSKQKPAVFIYNGPVGVGKTRLYSEFKNYCSLNNVVFIETDCRESEARPYGAMADLVLRLTAYSYRDTLEKYAPYLSFLLPGPDMFSDFPGLSINDDPQGTKDIIVQNISDYIMKFSGTTKAIAIYFNDLHWIDEGSAEILKALTYKLHLSRPDGIAVFASMNESLVKSHYLSAFLESEGVLVNDILPFDQGATYEYIVNIFGKGYIDKSLRDSIGEIKERAGGNPLFLQEMIKSLIDKDHIIKDKKYWKLVKPIHDVDIPDNLIDILRVRVSGLLSDPEIKKILQTLSLLRIDLSFDAIKNIIDRISSENIASVLLELEKFEVLQSINRDDGIYYTFNSKTIKSLINESVLNRKELCLYLGESLESHYEEKTDYIEEIAYQYLIGDNKYKALKYYEKCGDISQKLYLNEKAIKYFDIALGIAEDGDRIIELNIKKAISLEFIGRLDEAADIIKHCLKSSNRKYTGRLYSQLGKYLLTKGDIKGAKKCFDIFYRIYEKDGDYKHQEAILNLGDFYLAQAQYEKALKYYERYWDSCQAEDNIQKYFNVMNSMGSAHFMLSNYEESLKCYEISIELSRKTGDKRKFANAVGNMGNVYKQLGKYDKALDCFVTYRKISEEIGDKRGIGIATGNMGIIFKIRKDYSKAIECYSLYFNMSREIGFKKGMGISAGNLGNLYNELFKFDEALKYFEKQRDIAKEINDKRQLGSVSANMGILYYNRGEVKKALRYYGAYEDICLRSGDRIGLAIISQLSGNAYYELKEFERALKYIKESIRLFTGLSVRDHYLAEAFLCGSRICLETGRIESAFRFNEEAMGLAEKLDNYQIVISCKIQNIKIISSRDKDKAIQEFNKLLRYAEEDEQRAEIYFELYLLTKDYNLKAMAVDIYKRLYQISPLYQFKKKLEEMDGRL